MQEAGASPLAGDDTLAGIAPVAADVQGGAGIGWHRTQPGGFVLQDLFEAVLAGVLVAAVGVRFRVTVSHLAVRLLRARGDRGDRPPQRRREEKIAIAEDGCIPSSRTCPPCR